MLKVCIVVNVALVSRGVLFRLVGILQTKRFWARSILPRSPMKLTLKKLEVISTKELTGEQRRREIATILGLPEEVVQR
nr:hypothetical transcript [Hymenolepis microstoma]